MQQMEAIVRARGLVRRFGEGEAAVYGLRDVDLEVQRGESVAVVGPSGSGKSTLLHVIGGIESLDAGDLVVAGTPVARETSDPAMARYRRRTVGFVFQFFNLIPTMSVLENVLFPAMLDRRGAAAQARALDLLDQVGLAARARAAPDALSGGEQQRVALARALVNEPAVVLADEPTGNLDSASGERVLELLARLVRERGTTLIMATHAEAARQRMERTIRMRDGRIVSG